jgi:hypothetical protein
MLEIGPLETLGRIKMKALINCERGIEPLHAWRPFGKFLLNERSAVDSLLFPVKLEG